MDAVHRFLRKILPKLKYMDKLSGEQAFGDESSRKEQTVSVKIHVHFLHLDKSEIFGFRFERTRTARGADIVKDSREPFSVPMEIEYGNGGVLISEPDMTAVPLSVSIS